MRAVVAPNQIIGFPFGGLEEGERLFFRQGVAKCHGGDVR